MSSENELDKSSKQERGGLCSNLSISAVEQYLKKSTADGHIFQRGAERYILQ